MGLITIFFKAENEFGYIKAIIRAEDKDFFSALGTIYDSPDDIPKNDVFDLELDQVIDEVKPAEELIQDDNEPEELKADPDKGFGVVGSYEWHTNQIRSFASVKEVAAYTKEVTGKKIKIKPDSLIGTKVSALKTIKEFLNNANQSK